MAGGEDYYGQVVVYGNYNGTWVAVKVDADGSLMLADMDVDQVQPDAIEGTTWDTTLSSIVNNLNRIRYMIVNITDEAWGTASHSIADIWAKFHATTGHAHSGAANDGGPITDINNDLDMNTHKITAVTDPAAAQDAATKNYVDAVGKAWVAWTPTLTWGTGTPASITTVARWTRIGRIVFFEISINSNDSNGATSLTVSLPVTKASSSATAIVQGSESNGGASPAHIPITGYINSGTSVINFTNFRTGTDGQTIAVYLTGCYEVS